MTKKNLITFNVKQSHIDNGIPGDSCNCTFALALKDKFKTTSVDVRSASNIIINGVPFEPVDAKEFSRMTNFIRTVDNAESTHLEFDALKDRAADTYQNLILDAFKNVRSIKDYKKLLNKKVYLALPLISDTDTNALKLVNKLKPGKYTIKTVDE